MSRCLSDDALTRVHAELAAPAERAHLAGCAACAGRSRRLRREVDLITSVLRGTREPRARAAMATPRRWLPAAVALSAAALALLTWVEVAVWRAVTPVPPTMQPQEVAAILADVSASLFSVSGDPVAAASDDSSLSLEAMTQELDDNLGGEP
jgi:predicted anti-sigma-YlaC factor YlaD